MSSDGRGDPISALTALLGASVTVGDDKIPILDASATTTKYITVDELATAIVTLAAAFAQSGSAESWTVDGRLNESVYLMGYLSEAKRATVKAGTATDVTTEFQEAVTDAAGRPIILPGYGGNLIVTSQVAHTVNGSTRNPSLKLIGQGRDKTIFDNRVASGAMLKLDTTADNERQWGGRLKGFQIKTTTSPSSSDGIYIRRQQALELEDVYIVGLTGDGIEIEVASGDADGSEGITLRHCWIETCAGWGINCNTGAGVNELSFLTLDNTRIESCGTTSASSPPPSGGMKWKGQVCTLMNGTAFVTNENVAFYVPGGSGASNELLGYGVAFENNKNRHMLIQTLTLGKFFGTQFYNNASYTATVCVDMTTSSGSNLNVSFINSLVRITDDSSSITAFTWDSNCQDCSLEDTYWLDYDATGQTRFSNSGVGTRIIDDGIVLLGTATKTGLSRGDQCFINDRGIWGLSAAGTPFLLGKMTTNSDYQIASTSIRTKFPGYTHIRSLATGDMEAGSAGNNNVILIEDTTLGANFVVYLDGAFYRFKPRSVSADNGDAAATLTVAGDETTQIWNTPISTDRAVGLSTTGAYNGAWFRIVRTAAATGAFNLNVGTGPLKALGIGEFCVVEYNGSAWILTEYGAL